jgi:hypothetical protein
VGYDTNSGNAPLPLRKEVLRAVRWKLAEAAGGASLRLVGGALISIDSGGGLAENETGNDFFSSFLFLLGVSIRSISEGRVRVEKRSDGKRMRSRVGSNGFRRRWTVEAYYRPKWLK